ncbi:uncharacterized protein LOC117111013 [Anneissia japonica]|uniref:uncharacterized protein LOC117111013 n=1 Tax=Anneissia japonica TaxID=1529436 RepID=UPI0014259EA6|nr:uncharacterized protein LOC117111013 [Anneissia japonica]
MTTGFCCIFWPHDESFSICRLLFHNEITLVVLDANNNDSMEEACGGEQLSASKASVSTSTETLRPSALTFSASKPVTPGNEGDIRAIISDVTSLLVLSAMSNELYKSSASTDITHDQQVRLIEATSAVIQSLNQIIPREYRKSYTDSQGTISAIQQFKHSESSNSLASLEFKSCTSNDNSQSSDAFRSCDSQLDDIGCDSATESDIITPRPPSELEDSIYMSINSSTSQYEDMSCHTTDTEELVLTLQRLKQRLDHEITTALNDAIAWQEASQDTDGLALTVFLRQLHHQYIRDGQVTVTDQSWFSLLIEKALSSSLQAHDIVMLSKEIEALKMNTVIKDGLSGQAQETISVDTAIQTDDVLDTYSISSFDSEISERNLSPDSLLIPGPRHEHISSQQSVYTPPHHKPKRKLEVPSTLRGESDTHEVQSRTGCCPFLSCLKRMCLH